MAGRRAALGHAGMLVPPSSKLGPRATEAPTPVGTAVPPHGAAAVLQSSWAAKPARKASVGEAVHISPCCSQACWSSQSGSLPELRVGFGASQGPAGLCFRQLWVGRGCGMVTPSPGVSPIPSTARWPRREPGVGECWRLWPSWELQKLFCPEVGSSSSLLPFPCQSICCPAHFPSPFPAAFQAMEMFDVLAPSTAPCGWILCGLIFLLWLP